MAPDTGWRSSSQKSSPKNKTKRRKKRLPKGFGKNLILVVVALFLLGTIGVLGIFAFVSRDLPDPNSLTDRNVSQSTKIYDRTGEHLLYEIFGDENRTLTKLKEGFCDPEKYTDIEENGVPLIAVQSILSAEDDAFCDHHGFSVKGLARAVLSLGKSGGGSTLTQQLVKNSILTPERTIRRKIRELILSIELERRYTKDQILQIYFNEIPYGSTYYGIQTAARNYYDKDISDITLAEAATLAAIPQAPTRYLNNPDRLKVRRDWILGRMVELGFVSEEEASIAKEEDTSIRVKVTNITAPHFVFHVREELDEKYGQRAVETGGLKVITTLDYEKQIIGEEEVRKFVDENGEASGFSNAGLVAIDPKTGQILTMVGSKDYFNDEIDGQVNVTEALRQPGSSFKPIVYTQGFIEGYTPNTVLWDVKTDFPSSAGRYSPNNYDLKERGPIRIREALQGSLNITAVKMLYLVGVNDALDFAKSLGYTSFENRENFGLAIVLGGAEVKLVEHVAAFGVLANEGVRHETISILKVEDSDGTVLEEWEEKEGERVIDENIARTTTNVLSDNGARAYAFGLGSPLQLGGRPVAAKTGTTNDYHDAWTVGYTPSLVAGVWGGNNDNEKMHRGAGGSTVAAPIWNAFMRRVLEGQPIESFTPPSIGSTGKAILDGQLESKTVVIDKASGKLATEYTPESFREEKTFAGYHSILHYVSRGNPLGDPPINPENDPAYKKWEDAIVTWVNKQKEDGLDIEMGIAPTEKDDIHLPENFPTVRIKNPRENQELTSQNITVEANVSARRNISRVEFYIDGFFLGSKSTRPYIISTPIPSGITRGLHTLKVTAYDDVDNSGSDTSGVRLRRDGDKESVEILEPKNGQNIDATTNTFNVAVSLQNPGLYRVVTVFAEPTGGGNRSIVGNKIDPGAISSFVWNLPSPGEYIVTAQVQLKEGVTRIESSGVVVDVIGEEQVQNEEDGTAEEEPPTPPPGPIGVFGQEQKEDTPQE